MPTTASIQRVKPVRVRASRKRVSGPKPQLAEALKTLLNPGLDGDLKRARKLAELLDSRFQVGGIQFGLEGVIGLIPFVGDTVGALLGAYPLFLARRHKLGKTLQFRMAGNLAIEWLIGLIPILGDAFDVAFKANLRNLALLEAAAGRKGRP
jgi:hypothetical protein